MYGLYEEVTWGGGGPLWNGEPELRPERWQFWKDRLAALGEFDGVAERTGNLLGRLEIKWRV